MGATSIVVILCFLSYAFVHVSGHPNQAPSDSEFTWSMKNSEDEVDDFRSRSDGPLPSVAEFDETENEYKANEVDFDDEDDGYFELTSNKRSPHPASDRSFKNKEGYYLIEDLHHRVVGTKDRVKCNTNGVFRVGKINGTPYIKNKVTGRYLAINDRGHVYTALNKSADTAIRIYVTRALQVYLYRILKNPKRYLYLDVSSQSRTVSPTNLGNTSLFQVRLGNSC